MPAATAAKETTTSTTATISTISTTTTTTTTAPDICVYMPAATVAKEKMDTTRIQIEQAERDGDLGKAAELKYGVLPNLEKELVEKNKTIVEYQKDKRMLKEEVEDEDIAKVVALFFFLPMSFKF